MKRLKRLGLSLLCIALLAVVFSVVPSHSYKVDVAKGFAYGDPKAQTHVTSAGTFQDRKYGFPATYREIQSFHPADGAYAAASFEPQPMSLFYVGVNIVFWVGLMVALLAPVTIFWRKKALPAVEKVKGEPKESQVKADANPRD
jgi:hypothetical protein